MNDDLLQQVVIENEIYGFFDQSVLLLSSNLPNKISNHGIPHKLVFYSNILSGKIAVM